MLHLGPNTQFVGTPNKGGKEVLMNFELFLGNNKAYFSGQALKDPFKSKYEINSPFAKMKLNIHSDDMDSYVSLLVDNFCTLIVKYGKHSVYTDGVTWYREGCKVLKVEHTIYNYHWKRV
jgi:hypothetical protein